MNCLKVKAIQDHWQQFCSSFFLITVPSMPYKSPPPLDLNAARPALFRLHPKKELSIVLTYQALKSQEGDISQKILTE